MGNKFDKKMVSLGVVITASVCVCITFSRLIDGWGRVLGLFKKLWVAMTPFTIGLIIAFLLSPIMDFFRKSICLVAVKKFGADHDRIYRKSKVPAIILTMVSFISIMVGFLWLVIPKIYISLSDLVDNTPGYLDSAQAWVEKFASENKFIGDKLSNVIDYAEDNIYNFFVDKVMPNLDTIVVNVSSGVVIGVKAVFNLIIGLIVTVYLLGSKEVLLAQGRKVIYCLFSKKTGNKILEGLAYANMVFGGFINGKIIDSVIIGIICFVFTSAVGMKYAVLMSVIVGVTNIIPFFGPFIGAVPGALLALMDDPIMLVIFVVWIIVLQQFDGNILGPLILGDSTGLSGIWVLLAILVAGDLFGVPGMILGVPVFACFYALCAVFLRDNLRKKNLSSDTADYIGLKGFDEETGEPLYRERHEKRRKLSKKSGRNTKIRIKKLSGKADDTNQKGDLDNHRNTNKKAASVKTDKAKQKTDSSKSENTTKNNNTGNKA